MGRSGVVKSEVLSTEEGQQVPTSKPQPMPCNTQFPPNLVSRHETYPLCRNGVDKRDERQGEGKRKRPLQLPDSSPPSRFPPDDHHDPKRRGSGHVPPGSWETEKKEGKKKGIRFPGSQSPGDWESAASYSQKKVSYIHVCGVGKLYGLIQHHKWSSSHARTSHCWYRMSDDRYQRSFP